MELGLVMECVECCGVMWSDGAYAIAYPSVDGYSMK